MNDIHFRFHKVLNQWTSGALFSDVVGAIPAHYLGPLEIRMFYRNPGDPVNNGKTNINRKNMYTTAAVVEFSTTQLYGGRSLHRVRWLP